MLDRLGPRPRGHAIQALEQAHAVLDALLGGPTPRTWRTRLSTLAAEIDRRTKEIPPAPTAAASAEKGERLLEAAADALAEALRANRIWRSDA